MEYRISKTIGTVLEGRIPRKGWLQCKKAGYQGLAIQCWNAGYQELGTVFEGRIPRTGYSVERRDTKD